MATDKDVLKLDWNGAKEHLEGIIKVYNELIGMPGVNPHFALQGMNEDMARFGAGERSQELFDSMMIWDT